MNLMNMQILEFKVINLQYLAPLAILISAFLATISVQLSIKNTNFIEMKKKTEEKKKLYLDIQYLIISLDNDLHTYIKTLDYLNDDIKDNETTKSFVIQSKLQISENSLIEKLQSFESVNLLPINNEFHIHIISLCIQLSNLKVIHSVLVHDKEDIAQYEWNIFYNQSASEIIKLILHEKKEIISLLKMELDSDLCLIKTS